MVQPDVSSSSPTLPHEGKGGSSPHPSPLVPRPFLVCGIDEAGRGPLAGPVCAAAVILDPARKIPGLKDSKKLSAVHRLRLAGEIRARALAWAVAWASVEEIDRLNILNATLLAMRRAVEELRPAPHEALVDGNRCPALTIPCRAIVRGDDLEPAISAASILAKTERDQEMRRLADMFPGYGFERHAGYPTAEHLAALRTSGPCAIHRRSFGPVRDALAAGLFERDMAEINRAP